MRNILRQSLIALIAIIMIFAATACETNTAEQPDLPDPLDNLISFDLPEEYQLDREYPYDDNEDNPIIEKGYTSEQSGYFSVGVFSYKGNDCLGDVTQTIDLDEYIDRLDNLSEISIDGETAYLGTHDSDDMPGMVAVAYVKHGDYVFEFRLSNGDEQVSKAQLKDFERIVRSIKFTF